jgi:hypothetical protein
MHYLYLDESGNLGFDLHKIGTSRYFIITILAIESLKTCRALEKAIGRTLKYKMRHRGQDHVVELKGAKTVLEVKQYFYRFVQTLPFNLYTVILNKARLRDELQRNQNRVYNFAAYQTLKELPLETATHQVLLTVDRSKTKLEISRFDQYISQQFSYRIPPNVPFLINHNSSQENKLLQALDLFSWGVYRKYEEKDAEWYNMFREKIVSEQVYPPIK